MADQTFVRTGVMSRMTPGARIRQYQVIGERASGTNFVSRLLGRNSALRPSQAMGWKHGFAQASAIPPDLAVIGVVRRADDWVRSMHARPWHCSNEMQRLAFSEFIRAEWDTCVDRPRYFEGAEQAGTVGQPLQHDRHPLTGQRFANIFELRKTKLDGLISYRNRSCNFVLLRLETVVADPEGILDRLLQDMGQPPRNQAFRPVVKRLGMRFKPAVDVRPGTPDRISDDDAAFLRSSVDSNQESALGYRY